MNVKLVPFFLIAICFIYVIFNYAEKRNLKNSNLEQFNQLLLKIESSIKNNNYSQACLNSKKASDLINNNLIMFEKLEENYHWEEMQELLEVIPNQFCE